MSKIFEKAILKSGLTLSHSLYDENGNIAVAKSSKESISLRGKIRIKGSDGSVLNTHNCTIYGGRRFLLEALFRQQPSAAQQLTLNTILNCNANITPSLDENLSRAISLVGVGIGGADITFGSVIDPTSNDNNLFNIIPLRTVKSRLTGDEANQYFMGKMETVGGSNYYNYYLKKVETSGIVAKHESTDYEPSISDNDAVHDDNNPLSLYNIQTMTSVPIEISEKDVKDYFRATDGNINMARFNELALYFGVPVTITDGGISYTDYIAVEAFSHLTFNNRAMDSDGARYEFEYFLIS